MPSISCASNMTSKPYAGSFTSTAVPTISTLMRLLLQESRRISTFVASFFISMPTMATASVLIKWRISYPVTMAFPSAAEECTAWCAPCPFQSLPPLSQNEAHRKTPVNATISCVGSFISLLPILFGSVILLILESIVLGISFVLWWICFPERSSVGVYTPNTIPHWLSLPSIKHIRAEIFPTDWSSIPIRGRSIPLLLSVSFWMQTILSSRSPRKDVRLTMPVVNRSLSS